MRKAPGSKPCTSSSQWPNRTYEPFSPADAVHVLSAHHRWNGTAAQSSPPCWRACQNLSPPSPDGYWHASDSTTTAPAGASAEPLSTATSGELRSLCAPPRSSSLSSSRFLLSFLLR